MKSILSIKRNCTTATSKYDTDDSVKPPPQPTTNKKVSATATKSTTSSEVPEASSKPNDCLVTSQLRREGERAKAKRDFANKRRKEALLYLRQVERSIISNESSEGDEIKLQNAKEQTVCGSFSPY